MVVYKKFNFAKFRRPIPNKKVVIRKKGRSRKLAELYAFELSKKI